MKQFFDTSVLVAAFWNGHPQHEASLDRVSSAHPKTSFCGIHTLAEVYATMSSLPVRDPISPDQALLFVDEVRAHCSTVSLTEDEYFSTITKAANRGFTSGRIYDLLLLSCAVKCRADVILTWNLKHFRASDAKLASKVRTP